MSHKIPAKRVPKTSVLVPEMFSFWISGISRLWLNFYSFKLFNPRDFVLSWANGVSWAHGGGISSLIKALVSLGVLRKEVPVNKSWAWNHPGPASLWPRAAHSPGSGRCAPKCDSGAVCGGEARPPRSRSARVPETNCWCSGALTEMHWQEPVVRLSAQARGLGALSPAAWQASSVHHLTVTVVLLPRSAL